MSFSKAKFTAAAQPAPPTTPDLYLYRLGKSDAKPTDSKAAIPVPSQMKEMTHCTIISYAELQLADSLGEGAFAQVLKGKYKTIDVAVKFYSYRDRDDVGRELVVLARIAKDGFEKHPNLIGFYGAGYDTTKCEYHLVLELMSNKSLGGYLQNLKEGLDWPLILKIAIGIAAGCVDLHAMGLIYRDLKPGNVLLGDDKFEQVKLSDFGLTIKTTDKEPYSGTPVWMGPEVMKDQVQQASDVYSFGVVLLQMLAPAVFLEYIDSVGFAWMGNIPKNISGLAESILDPLKCSGATAEEQKDFVENVVRKCIDIDPAKRPTMQVVLDKLKQLQNTYLQRMGIAKAVPAVTSSALMMHGKFKPPAAPPPAVDKLKPYIELEPVSFGFGFGRCWG